MVTISENYLVFEINKATKGKHIHWKIITLGLGQKAETLTFQVAN